MKPDPKPFVRCAKNLAHIFRYKDKPMRCKLPHAHQGPHRYDPKEAR
jgi:hypothetical protein